MMSVTLRDILVAFFIVGGSLVVLRRYRKAVAARHLRDILTELKNRESSEPSDRHPSASPPGAGARRPV
jgi:hypothetical protein